MRWPWTNSPPREGDATDAVAQILAGLASGEITPVSGLQASTVQPQPWHMRARTLPPWLPVCPLGFAIDYA